MVGICPAHRININHKYIIMLETAERDGLSSNINLVVDASYADINAANTNTYT